MLFPTNAHVSHPLLENINAINSAPNNAMREKHSGTSRLLAEFILYQEFRVIRT